jgi:hypothetical protein
VDPSARQLCRGPRFQRRHTRCSTQGMDERSRRLLSPDAAPRVEVPRPPPPAPRAFRLPPGVVTVKPRRAATAPGLGPIMVSPSATPPRGERTLAWFKVGDELAADATEPAAEDDVFAPRTLAVRQIALYGATVAALGGTLATAMFLLLG